MNAANLDGAFFLDTNVLLYSFDESAPAKQRISRELQAYAQQSGMGVISTQVVQEFLHASFRKGPWVLTHAEAQDYLRVVLWPICKVVTSLELLESAVEIRAETGYAFYDSLIVAAAIQAKCRWLVSEDMQHERKVRGLKIINPYK